MIDDTKRPDRGEVTHWLMCIEEMRGSGPFRYNIVTTRAPARQLLYLNDLVEKQRDRTTTAIVVLWATEITAEEFAALKEKL